MSLIIKSVELPRLLVVGLAMAVAILGSTASFAEVSSTTGAAVEVSPPASVLASVSTAPDISGVLNQGNHQAHWENEE